jgi:hypothetical protein
MLAIFTRRPILAAVFFEQHLRDGEHMGRTRLLTRHTRFWESVGLTSKGKWAARNDARLG